MKCECANTCYYCLTELLPSVLESDIKNFYDAGGERLLTLHTRNKRIPVPEVCEGIENNIHIDWDTDTHSIYLSIFRGNTSAVLGILTDFTYSTGYNKDAIIFNSGFSEKNTNEVERKLLNVFS